MVTVICITYNQEAFIAEALESFVTQQTSFPFQVFVGDDASTDGTAAIVKAYAEKYPDIVVPFIRARNLGAQHNLIDLISHASSKYIALCDGDDYWTDPRKLQRQYDYLEAHPELPACIEKTEILAPEDWHLRDWYVPNAEGRYFFPEAMPMAGYQPGQQTFKLYQLIRGFPGHTSTYFIRWDYSVEFPDWYYEGIFGDFTLMLLQLGPHDLGFIDTVSSVYRINPGSIFYNEDRWTHYLNTRIDYIKCLFGLIDYALDHWPKYPIVELENRIKWEVANYINAALRLDELGKITELIEQFPDAATLAFRAFTSFYFDARRMQNDWTWKGYQSLVRNPEHRAATRSLVQKFLREDEQDAKWEAKKAEFEEERRAKLYWKLAKTPKLANVWVVAGFNHRGYEDNAKYFYEYVLEHHREINVYWYTGDARLHQQLQAEGKPVILAGTDECLRVLGMAALAVIDHFRMSDLDVLSGLNAGTKIVQLWHGVGLKAIGDLKNTEVPGVQFSPDLLAQPGDSAAELAQKQKRYHQLAYTRELMEEYFAMLIPGPEREKSIAAPFGVDESRWIKAGNPRNINLYTQVPDLAHPKILYAPTYRWSVEAERGLVDRLLDALEPIQQMMDDVEGTFVVRLHPHTWRNYRTRLGHALAAYPRVELDPGKDIYADLGTYAVLISDYSSIAYDFVMIDRPVVFFGYDLIDFEAHEDQLNYDWAEYSPGAQVTNWNEACDAVREYLADPTRDSAWRQRVAAEFFYPEVNDAQNSERIVAALKQRLKLA
ncbi:MAG: CDP-glycerol glycerophosphotransferase family protein [Propionibacteriaceae bacterium]|nr:CDP-glycerol glycerophosphotransferase family protein [Propionibacteriaceae bacterium]